MIFWTTCDNERKIIEEETDGKLLLSTFVLTND